MQKKIIAISSFFILLFTNGIFAINEAPPYPHLKRIKGNGYTVAYSPSFCKKSYAKPKTDGPSYEHLLICRINRYSKTEYRVTFTEGPSDDPAFIIEVKKRSAWKFLKELGGNELYIPGNGNLYTRSRANEMFFTRKKFKVTPGWVKEAPQAYYYVGISTKTLRPIQLYLAPGSKKVVANLPKGYPVQVLVNQKQYYLVVTSFGLTGWAKLTGTQWENKVFKEIYFAGD